MSATRNRYAGLLGVLLAVALVAALVRLVTAGGSHAASATAAPGAVAAPVPVEQLPQPAGAARATDLATAGTISRTVRVRSSSVGSQDSRMEIVVGKQHIPFRNGGRIELADGLAAEVFLDPYPPTKLKLWLDLRLTRAPQGTPVENASATMDYDMELMPHGASTATARNVGSGHYLYVVDDSMYGAWIHRLRIVVGGRTHEVRVVVVTAPA